MVEKEMLNLLGIQPNSKARDPKVGDQNIQICSDFDEDEVDEEEEEEEEEDEDDDDDDDEDGEENSQMTASEDETSWISWFLSLRGNDFFCEVDEAFIQDDFNLTGLSSQVPYYDYALDMILDADIPVDKLSDKEHEIVETAAEVLYGLIHARYILSSAGMHKMYDKYQAVDFGRCPRSFCKGQPVLPNGLSDVTREFTVEVYCPRCLETYHPRSSKHANLDGAYFGTTFCHLFLLTHPELIVPKPVESYTPRIFGFRINDSSLYFKLRETNKAKENKRKVVKAKGHPVSNGLGTTIPPAVDLDSTNHPVPSSSRGKNGKNFGNSPNDMAPIGMERLQPFLDIMEAEEGAIPASAPATAPASRIRRGGPFDAEEPGIGQQHQPMRGNHH